MVTHLKTGPKYKSLTRKTEIVYIVCCAQNSITSIEVGVHRAIGKAIQRPYRTNILITISDHFSASLGARKDGSGKTINTYKKKPRISEVFDNRYKINVLSTE